MIRMMVVVKLIHALTVSPEIKKELTACVFSDEMVTWMSQYKKCKKLLSI